VTEGEAACFTVAVSGRPAPRVTWQHNGIDVVEGGSPYFEAVYSPDGLRHSLRIGEVFADDGGDVCVTAENDAGAVSASASLAVRRQFYYYLSTPRKPNDVIVISLSVCSAPCLMPCSCCAPRILIYNFTHLSAE